MTLNIKFALQMFKFPFTFSLRSAGNKAKECLKTSNSHFKTTMHLKILKDNILALFSFYN